MPACCRMGIPCLLAGMKNAFAGAKAGLPEAEGLAGAEYNGVLQFSTKREQRAELVSIALLVLKLLVYVAIAAGAVYLLIRSPVAY
jgi:hypothetical protein